MVYALAVITCLGIAAAVYFSVKSRKEDAVAPATNPSTDAGDNKPLGGDGTK